MGLSKRYLDTNTQSLPFSVDRLAAEMEEKLPEVVFAYLLGSAAEAGIIAPYSDLDIAVYVSGKPDFELYTRLQDICDAVVGSVRCDAGILNNAEPVYGFEALKGKLLFVRDREAWLTFYSRTCREYESRMFHYEKQRQYRLEIQNEV